MRKDSNHNKVRFCWHVCVCKYCLCHILLLTGVLPPGKKFHLFVSHSTSDVELAREAVVRPLRNKHNLKALACYHCMPDAHHFNDHHISQAMTESCVIVVGISEPYLSSNRYSSRYKFALSQCVFCSGV